VLINNYVWDIPSPAKTNKLLDLILGNWQVS